MAERRTKSTSSGTGVPLVNARERGPRDRDVSPMDTRDMRVFDKTGVTLVTSRAGHTCHFKLSLYVAHTFDSGQTWTTIDATPSDPVQSGCMMQGGSNPCRNLLDFRGEAVDKEGRVLVGYADGCLGCSDPAGSRARKATIARQVNGRRLFAAYDPVGGPSPTPMPAGSPTPTCTTAAVSEDGGNTFPLDRINPLNSVGSGDDPEGATDDRQWVAAFGDGIAYSTVRNLAVAVGSGNFHMSKTTDAGKTWHCANRRTTR